MAPHACHHTATDEAHHGIIGTTIAIFCQPAEPGNGSTWQARYDITQRLRGSPGRYRKAQALVGTLPATHSRSRFARGSEGNTNEKNICPYTGIEIRASNASLIFSYPSSLWHYRSSLRDQYVTGPTVCEVIIHASRCPSSAAYYTGRLQPLPYIGGRQFAAAHQWKFFCTKTTAYNY